MIAVLRFFDVLSVVLLLAVGTWFLLPSNVFINQLSLKVENGMVHFTRELPFGEVTARWWSEITVPEYGSYECSSGAPRMAFYQEVPGDTVTYNLGAWAQPCLAKGSLYVLSSHRQVMLFGVIPLRPTRSVEKVEPP